MTGLYGRMLFGKLVKNNEAAYFVMYFHYLIISSFNANQIEWLDLDSEMTASPQLLQQDSAQMTQYIFTP